MCGLGGCACPPAAKKAEVKVKPLFNLLPHTVDVNDEAAGHAHVRMRTGGPCLLSTIQL